VNTDIKVLGTGFRETLRVLRGGEISCKLEMCKIDAKKTRKTEREKKSSKKG